MDDVRPALLAVLRSLIGQSCERSLAANSLKLRFGGDNVGADPACNGLVIDQSDWNLGENIAATQDTNKCDMSKHFGCVRSALGINGDFDRARRLSLGGKRQKHANLIEAVLLPKGVSLLRPGHG